MGDDDDEEFSLNMAVAVAAPRPAPAPAPRKVVVLNNSSTSTAPSSSSSRSPLDAVARELQPHADSAGNAKQKPGSGGAASNQPHSRAQGSFSSNPRSSEESRVERGAGPSAYSASTGGAARSGHQGGQTHDQKNEQRSSAAAGSGRAANTDEAASSSSSSSSSQPLSYHPPNNHAAAAASSFDSSRRRHEKGAPAKTPVIIPASAASGSFTITTYDIDADGHQTQRSGGITAASTSSSSATTAASSSSSSSSNLPPAEAFAALGLDARLVSKLVASRTGSGSTSSSSTSGLAFTPSTSSSHVASTANVVRGHLRDGFGLVQPTRVQKGVIPLALEHKSLIVKSETGSGKTLAFVLPILHNLLAAMDAAESTGAALSRSEATRAVIISPTRELCAQIFSVVTRICQPFPSIVPCLLAGGEKRKSEKARLRKGCAIVVATPGRLLDHLRTTESFICSAATLDWIVLDEADRLLDMGFGTQVREISEEIKKRGGAGGAGAASHSPATLLLSATAGPAVRELAMSLLFSDAVFVDASASAAMRAAKASLKDESDTKQKKEGEDGEEGESDDVDDEHSKSSSAPPTITYSAPKQLQQTAMLVPLKWRLVTILAIVYQAIRRGEARVAKEQRDKRKEALIRGGEGASNMDDSSAGGGCKAILFVSTTDGADFHHALLSSVLPRLLRRSASSASFPVLRLHGNVPQNERTSVFRTFSACTSGLLIATDVAARGLDLPAVDWILQADAPSETGDYVHRIGRTARRGQKGAAVILLQPHEAPYLDLLRAAGLDVLQVDSSSALATLADVPLPLDMLATTITPHSERDGISNAFGGAAAGKNNGGGGRNSSSADAGGQKRGRFSVLDSGLLGASVKEAEATAAASAAAASAHASEERNGRGPKEDEKDPATGVSSRLLHLRDYAMKLRSQGGNAAAHAPGGSSGMARVAEVFAVAWQYWLEELVLLGLPLHGGRVGEGDDEEQGQGTNGPITVPRVPILPLARSAFLSFVRAYATHEKAVRHIFHPRSLHLGHGAKAFGLREQPTAASRQSRKDGSNAAAEEEENAANAAAAEAADDEAAFRGQQHQQQKGKAMSSSSSAAAGSGGGGNARFPGGYDDDDEDDSDDSDDSGILLKRRRKQPEQQRQIVQRRDRVKEERAKSAANGGGNASSNKQASAPALIGRSWDGGATRHAASTLRFKAPGEVEAAAKAKAAKRPAAMSEFEA